MARASTVRSSRSRRSIGFALFVIGLIATWEGLKFLAGDPWRINSEIANIPINLFHNPPFRVSQLSDLQLPHVARSNW